MVQDAERFADEDKQKRESVELRNQAETMIYSTEKSLAEMGDKLPEEDKSKIEATKEQLRKSLEGDDTEAIKGDLEALTQASHKLAEMLYQQQAQQQAEAGPEGAPGAEAEGGPGQEKAKSNEEDIVDADFEEVKKDK